MVKIQVISSCSFGMAKNPTSNTRMELSPLDIRLLVFSPIQRGLLYHKPQSQEFEFETFIDHLKNSLSRTLDFFPQLAGRLGTVKNNDDNNTTSFFLDCNNAGVQFTHAIAHGLSVSDILEPIYVPEIVFSFFPLTGVANYDGVSNPLLSVQITELVDGYFIGCTANRAVADGVSFWHFVNSWSEISRGSDSISKTPVFQNWFPRNIISDNNIRPILNKLSTPTTQLLDRVFHFSKENIGKLKSRANSESGTDKEISSFQALTAHIWRSVTRARRGFREPNSEDDEICSCFLAVDVRRRIPLPDGYFGNGAYPARLAVSEIELLRNGVGWAALKLNEFVAVQSSEAAKEFLGEWVKNPSEVTVVDNSLSVTGSQWFDVYGNDFGWGKPAATRCGVTLKVDGAMTVSPAPQYSGGGVHVLACLEPRIMRALGEDAEFVEVVTV